MEHQQNNHHSYIISQIAAAVASTAAFFMFQEDGCLLGTKYSSKNIKRECSDINGYIMTQAKYLRYSA